jgi:hypothetical protein
LGLLFPTEWKNKCSKPSTRIWWSAGRTYLKPLTSCDWAWTRFCNLQEWASGYVIQTVASLMTGLLCSRTKKHHRRYPWSPKLRYSLRWNEDKMYCRRCCLHLSSPFFTQNQVVQENGVIVLKNPSWTYQKWPWCLNRNIESVKTPSGNQTWHAGKSSR